MLTYVGVILDIYDGQGNLPQSGTAVFTPSAVLTGAWATITAVFRPYRMPAAELLATDNGALAPSGWRWQVAFGGMTGAPPGFSFPLPAAPSGFTATGASPCVFTAAGSAYADGAMVVLSGASLPAGFTAGVTYYVVSASGTSFGLAATAGGAAIGSTSPGSGTVATAAVYLSSLAA